MALFVDKQEQEKSDRGRGWDLGKLFVAFSSHHPYVQGPVFGPVRLVSVNPRQISVTIIRKKIEDGRTIEATKGFLLATSDIDNRYVINQAWLSQFTGHDLARISDSCSPPSEPKGPWDSFIIYAQPEEDK